MFRNFKTQKKEINVVLADLVADLAGEVWQSLDNHDFDSIVLHEKTINPDGSDCEVTAIKICGTSEESIIFPGHAGLKIFDMYEVANAGNQEIWTEFVLTITPDGKFEIQYSYKK